MSGTKRRGTKEKKKGRWKILQVQSHSIDVVITQETECAVQGWLWKDSTKEHLRLFQRGNNLRGRWMVANERHTDRYGPRPTFGRIDFGFVESRTAGNQQPPGLGWENQGTAEIGFCT